MPTFQTGSLRLRFVFQEKHGEAVAEVQWWGAGGGRASHAQLPRALPWTFQSWEVAGPGSQGPWSPTLPWDFLFWAIIHFSLLCKPRFGFSVLVAQKILLCVCVRVCGRFIRRGQKGDRMEPLRDA